MCACFAQRPDFETIKISDFGQAQVLPEQPVLAGSGHGIGKPPWSSPEKYFGREFHGPKTFDSALFFKIGSTLKIKL
jgi:hypothetical protein